MQLETNGAVTPDDAVAYAARILQDQLNVFVNFEEPRKEVIAEAIPDFAFNPALLKKVDELELGSLGELSEERQHRLYRRPHPTEVKGRRCDAEFRPQVARPNQGSARSMGLHLGMEVPGWPPDNIDELAKRFEDHY